jgi:hypothetical protein
VLCLNGLKFSGKEQGYPLEYGRPAEHKEPVRGIGLVPGLIKVEKVHQLKKATGRTCSGAHEFQKRKLNQSQYQITTVPWPVNAAGYVFLCSFVSKA